MSIEIAIQSASVVATCLAVAVALFPGFFQRLCAREFVRIQPQNLGGTVPKTKDGRPVVYFHLKARNRCPSLAVHSCRVMLMKAERLDPRNKTFNDVGLHVPLQFVWSPKHKSGEPECRTLVQEEVFDFLMMNQPQDGTASTAYPVLYSYLTDCELAVRAGETVRYHMSVVGNEFASKRPQIWEVYWDGVWTNKAAEIAQHLTIRELDNK